MDTKIVAKRNLATFLYQEVSPTDQSSQEGVLEKLARLGFVVNKERVLAEDMEQIWDFIQKVAQLERIFPTISMGLSSRSMT